MPDTTSEQIAEVLRAANASGWPRTPRSKRADALEKIAAALESNREAIEASAAAEAHLPAARLTGEMNRTTGQIRMFARLIRDTGYLDIRMEEALPERQPVPRPDLRRVLEPIGPVAVFGASNFPLAFSVAGGDTASALAAGCPVVVKAHPAHLETCRLVAKAIVSAGLPDGTFAMVEGGEEVGQALAAHPEVRAVGFTGSFTAGTALWRTANARPRPISVFAEMGSVNPVVVLPGAQTDAWAQAYADSLALGVGQFCTNPGLVIGSGIEAWLSKVAAILDEKPEAPMLTPAILKNYEAGVARHRSDPRLRELTQVRGGSAPALFLSSGLQDPIHAEEVFGPCAVAIETSDPLAVLRELPGQLTATLLCGDREGDQQMVRALADLAGRVVVNGMPTGVEVGESMQHGGPWPATTDSRFTSVGTAAIARWLRPVCYQNVPAWMLPEELR